MKIWFESQVSEEHPATGRLLHPGVNEFEPAMAIELKRTLGDRIRLATPGEVLRAERAAAAAEKRSQAAAEQAAQEDLASAAAAAAELEAQRDAAARELGIVDERTDAVDVAVHSGEAPFDAAAPEGEV